MNKNEIYLSKKIKMILNNSHLLLLSNTFKNRFKNDLISKLL